MLWQPKCWYWCWNCLCPFYELHMQFAITTICNLIIIILATTIKITKQSRYRNFDNNFNYKNNNTEVVKTTTVVMITVTKCIHDDVIKWKHFPRYRSFTGHRWIPSQRPGTQSFDVSLIYVWTNGWINNRGAADLRRHRTNSDVSVI